MAKGRVNVRIQAEMGPEELFFKKEDEKIVRELREKTIKEADDKYREEHMNHCFRCGTKSLVEVDRGDVKIDICVNENCGAIHLDPGELERILKDEKAISIIRKSVLSIFTK
jgi:hypothetical protein